MKTIGLLGGMSWESPALYYKLINEEVKKQLGGLHSAKVVLYSVDFDEIEKLQHYGNWDETAKILSQASKNIQNASADFIVLCTNTMHKVLPQIEKNIEELCLGIVKEDSKKEYLRIIDDLVSKGAQGVILGCTEIGMLIKNEDTKVKLFDTTHIHSIEAVKQALEN